MTDQPTRRDLLATGAQLTAAAALMPATASAAAPAAPPQGVRPFRVDVPQARIDRIMARVKDVEWPDNPQVADPWAYGAGLEQMKELVDWWATRYNWRAREDAINAFPQFMARVEDYDIHFIHVKGSGKNPTPLLILHGWPNTFLEFVKVIMPLAHPEQFGGNAEDGFSVIVPSLPGFGFSSKPPKPISMRTCARLMDKLMTQVLGYKGYIAQGGDIGMAIIREMGFDAPECKALHFNLLVAGGQPTFNDEEKAAAASYARFRQDEGAYSHINSTKPLTQAYGMTDSPVGTAAWIFEKFVTWADVKETDPWSVFTKNHVIDNVMIFMITNTYQTAAWYYAGGREEPQAPRQGKIEKPSAFLHFKNDIGFWPRSYAERHFSNVARWTEIPTGGHFGAYEKPDEFMEDLRVFDRQLKAIKRT